MPDKMQLFFALGLVMFLALSGKIEQVITVLKEKPTETPAPAPAPGEPGVPEWPVA